MTPESLRPTLRRALPLWLRIGVAVVIGYFTATLAGGLFLAGRLGDADDVARLARLEHHLEALLPIARESFAADDAGTLRATAKALSHIEDIRLTAMRTDGAVVAESDRPLPLASHADRPEFIAAMSTGEGRRERDSSTVGERMLYLARRVDSATGEPLGVLRASTPIRARDDALAELYVLLLLSFLTGIPVAGLVAWLAARRIAGPLEDMTIAATRMAGGDFETLPRGERNDEAGRLAESLRRMGQNIAEMLETSAADHAELAAIVGSMTEGVLAVDESERVVRANRGVARALELPAPPLPGEPMATLVRVPALTEIVRAALAGDPPPVRDVDLAGTAPRVVNVSAATIRSSEDRPVGAVVVLRDVTELRRLERARLDFVANVSHELRTPVAAVLGALETLQMLDDGDEAELEARERFLASASRNAHRLSAIVTDLLALSSIETEGRTLERWPVPLLRSIRSVSTSLRAQVEGAEVDLLVPAADEVEVDVMGHESRMDLIWGNLIGNAIKYTPKGRRVEVSVSADPATGMARITVADSGLGIPADSLPRVFERFYRVDKSRSRDQGGTGLGLAIVKHIVRAHRGSIRVESRLGEGTTFHVELPLATAAEGDAAA